jgi:hypothetical protein
MGADQKCGGLTMRLFLYIATFFCWLTATSGRAAVLFVTCNDTYRSYELRYDDELGTLMSVVNGRMSKLNIQNLKSEYGSVTILGTLPERGVMFTFVYRFTTSITYDWGNGIISTDSCVVNRREAR